MKPFSRDVRERIVAMYERPESSSPRVAKQFQVSESTVRRDVKQWRETGTLTPKPATAGRSPKIVVDELTQLCDLVTRQSDASQDELRERLAQHTGVRASQPTLCRALQRARITRKKRRDEPQSNSGTM